MTFSASDPSLFSSYYAYVLVVEDDPDLRESLGLLLKQNDLGPLLCESAEQALEQLQQFQPDLVLTDLNLPGMSGFELIRHLHAQEKTSTLPIIVLSGVNREQAWRKSMNLGVEDFLPKPSSASDLIRAVKTRLTRSKSLVGREQREKLRTEHKLRDLTGVIQQLEQVEQRKDAVLLVLQTILREFHLTHGAVYWKGEIDWFEGEDQMEFYAEASHQSDAPVQWPPHLASAHPSVEQIIARKHPLLLNQVEPPPLIPGTQPDRLVLAPLLDQGEVTGVLLAMGGPAKVAFNDRDALFLETLARMAMMASKNSHMLQVIQIQVQTLEDRVLEKTQAIRNLLNYTGQGILAFGDDYRIHNDYSAPCLEFFGEPIAGKNALELLFPGDSPDAQKSRAATQELMDLLLSGTGTLDLFEDFLPQEIELKARILSVGYRLIPSVGHEGPRLMVLLDDVTRERQLTREVEDEKERHELILRVALDREGFLQFLRDAERLFQQLEEDLQVPLEQLDLNAVMRHFHTLKGGGASYGLKLLAEHAHSLEESLEPVRRQTEELSVERVQELIGALPILRDKLNEQLKVLKGTALERDLTRNERSFQLSESRLHQLKHDFRTLLQEHNSSTELQNTVEATLTQLERQPLGPVLYKYATQARGLAERLGKQVQVHVSGEAVEVRHTPLESLFSALVHLVRNAVDHGLESPEDRVAQGKPPEGHLWIEATLTGTCLELRIREDGRGVDVSQVKNRALEKGLASEEEVEQWSDAQALDCLFQPGFTTKAAVTATSGRGVGLDAVRDEVLRLQGKIDLQSTFGAGTEFRLQLPNEQI